MTIRRVLTTAAIAVAMAFTVAATTAQADDCDDIMDALKKLGERVMNYKDDAKTPLAVCGAVGQVLGILKASREAAAECYDEGDKSAPRSCLTWTRRTRSWNRKSIPSASDRETVSHRRPLRIIPCPMIAPRRPAPLRWRVVARLASALGLEAKPG
jgi:hypothetical protein